MKSSPKSKLGMQGHYVSPIWVYLLLFCPNISHFDSDLTICIYILQYLALFTYIYPHLALFNLIWLYLPLISLI